MKNKTEIFEKLSNARKFPSPSKTAMEIVRLCNDERASLNDISNVIRVDPALSAELLKYANSAFLTTGIPVSSIEKAAINLGMVTVANLAVGFSLLAGHRLGKCKSFNYMLFWSASLAQAVAAKKFAENNRDHCAEEMFVCGLLAHMGELGLATAFPDEYAAILDRKLPRRKRKAEERRCFELDSAELTAELFLSWGLPEIYALAAGLHEEFLTDNSDGSDIDYVTRLLNGAFKISLFIHSDLEAPTWPVLLRTLEECSTDKVPDGRDFVLDTIATWEDLGASFNITLSPKKMVDNLSHFLGQAS